MRCVPKRMRRITVTSRTRILTPIVISDEWIQKIKDSEPEFQEQKAARYEKEFDIPAYDISILTASKKMADLFEADGFTLEQIQRKHQTG